MTKPLPGIRSGRAGLLAISLILIYLAVGLLAAACPAEPATSPHGHRHAGGSEHGAMVHSLLCAWSCQAGSALDLGHTYPVSAPLLPVVGLLAVAHRVVFSSIISLVAARAPPVRLSPA